MSSTSTAVSTSLVAKKTGQTVTKKSTLDLAQIEQQAKAVNMTTAKYCETLGISMQELMASSLDGADIQVLNSNTKDIILPQGFDEERAIFVLTAALAAKQKELNFNRTFPCIPVDGMFAFAKAMKKVMGFTSLKGNPSFFGEQPPIMIQLQVALDQTVQVPYCKILPPAWEGGYLQPFIKGHDSLVISGVVRQKYKDQVDEIFDETQRILLNDSIYKGKAISMDFTFLEKGEGYSPELHAPTFMDVRDVQMNNLILNEEIQIRLESEIWNRITQPEACLENGMLIKHGLLLSGPFGTGKTLTARITAMLCEQSGYTFIYLKTPSQLVNVLSLAKRYAPAVVFAEDIDRVLSGERNSFINDVSNALDGIDSKTSPIITILTSNTPEAINPVNIRPGRISSTIVLSPPGEKAAGEFVRCYAVNKEGNSLLTSNFDFAAAGVALAGNVPAFINEAVNRAKGSAIFKHKTADIVGKISTDDIIVAARSLDSHLELMKGKPLTEAEKLDNALKFVVTHLFKDYSLEEVQQAIDKNVDKIADHLGLK